MNLKTKNGMKRTNLMFILKLVTAVITAIAGTLGVQAMV
jgi:hypothetical protein